MGRKSHAPTRLVVGVTDLATTDPELAEQLVDTDPTTVVAGSVRKLLWRCPNHEQPYEATGDSRARGSGCPYCSGNAVLSGYNDLATTHPELAAELVGTDPTMVRAGTNRVLLWRCPNHDEPYPSRGNRRLAGHGCGYCHGMKVLPGYNDMATTRPDLAAELVGTDPTSVMASSNLLLLWRCPKHEEPYPALAPNRAKGRGCGICAGLVVVPGLNDLATTHPHLAAELVGTDPRTITAKKHSHEFWRCPNHAEPYRTSPARRARGVRCLYCAGSLVLAGYNDMATTHPELAVELVGDDPTRVMAGTGRMLTWRCPNHEQTYQCIGAIRVRGVGCGICTGMKVAPGFNDLATTHPLLAAQLVSADPTTMTAGSNKKHRWRCPDCGHEWSTTVNSRSRGRGCPACAVAGFDPTKPAHLYLMERHGEQQVGITGNMHVRIRTHRKAGWTLLDQAGPMPGYAALATEVVVKRWLRDQVGTIPGTTESWSTAALEVSSLSELLMLARVGV